MSRQVRDAFGLGAVTAATVWFLSPPLTWWLVGVIVAAVLLVNPRTPQP